MKNIKLGICANTKCEKEFKAHGSQIFCSATCSLTDAEANKRRQEAMPVKKCKCCGEEFKLHSGVQAFCSQRCRLNLSNKQITNRMYQSISGNWRRYYKRIISYKHRRRNLTIEMIIGLHEQQGGRCALTGWELECKLERGVKNPRNASIDRIVAGGPYEIENIRLVCRAANCFRSDQSDQSLVEMCRAIVSTIG